MDYQAAKDLAYLIADVKNLHERLKKLENEKTTN
jgi:hypothetical protein